MVRGDSAAASAESAESSRQVVRKTQPTKHWAGHEARSNVRKRNARSQIADHGGDVKMCCKTQHPRRVQRSVGNRRSRHPSEKPTKTRTNSHLRVRRLRCGVVAHSESPTKNRSERLRSGVGDICGVVTTGCPKHTTHKT